MIVYRFEKNGIGPYIGGIKVAMGSFYDHSSRTRTTKVYASKFNQIVNRVDSKQRMDNWQKSHADKKYLFGCASKEMLRTYFRGCFKPLFKEGYRIKRYKVPDNEIIDMGIEVAFPVKYHKLQTVHNIKEKTHHDW